MQDSEIREALIDRAHLDPAEEPAARKLPRSKLEQLAEEREALWRECERLIERD